MTDSVSFIRIRYIKVNLLKYCGRGWMLEILNAPCNVVPGRGRVPRQKEQIASIP